MGKLFKSKGIVSSSWSSSSPYLLIWTSKIHYYGLFCVHVLTAGSKFAVGSGAKTIAVSRLDRSQGSDWYVSKLIKGHKSSVRHVCVCLCRFLVFCFFRAMEQDRQIYRCPRNVIYFEHKTY